MPALAAPMDALPAGTRVQVKGRLVGPRAVVAEEIELDPRPGGKAGLGAVIERVDAEAKTLTAAGIKISMSEETVLEGESREPIEFTAFKRGQWVSADGTLGEDGVLEASEARIKPQKPGKTRQTQFEGRVQRVDTAGDTFTLLGATVTVTPQTLITERPGGSGKVKSETP